MHLRPSVLASALALLLCAAPAAFAQDLVPRLCPQGHATLDDAAAFCATCGAPLPPSGKASAAVPDAPAPSARRESAAAAIRADARLARDEKGGKSPALLLAAVRNARALLALEPDALPKGAGAELAKREFSLLGRLSLKTVPCPRCNGAGTEKVPLPPSPPPKKGSLESVSVMRTPSQQTRTCAFCGGEGTVPCVRPRSEVEGQVRLGQRDYRTQAQGAGRELHHGLLLPAGLAGALSARDAARMLRAVPATCESCAGTGTVPCRTCSGFGLRDCPDRAFHENQVKPQSGRGNDVSEEKIEHYVLDMPSGARPSCPRCGQKGMPPGAVRCSDCAGKGVAACPRCGGTGINAECRTCNGDGVARCAACRGTGKDGAGAPCAACRGEGETLCSACGGNGHAR